MVAPLLGLLGLAGGALGQDWYFGREAREGQEKLKGLLGTPPEQMPSGVMGPPGPGTGLMGDPSSIQKQLEFKLGLMGLNPRQRGAANELVESVLGRANQQLGWERQAGENAMGRAQAQQHWEGDTARIESQFAATQQQHREEFAFNKEKYGEDVAWRQYTFGVERAQAARTEARLAASTALNNVLTRLQIQEKLNPQAEVKLPPGYRGVMLPTQPPLGAGVMGPPRPDAGEMRAVPMMGTDDWVKGQTAVDLTGGARMSIQKYLKHVQDNGFQKTGEQAGVQKELYTRVQDAIRVLRNSGTMNINEMPIIKEELPDPTEVLRSPVSQNFVLGHLHSLQEGFGFKEQQLRERYKGWNLTFVDLPALVEAGGVDAPPAGSTRFGSTPGGAASMRGKAPYR